MSDFSTVSTEDLRALYLPKAEKLKQLRAECKAMEADISPLRDELTERDNKHTLILNAVMDGKQKLLLAVGTPKEVIEAAEAEFAAMKAAKEARRAAAKEAA